MDKEALWSASEDDLSNLGLIEKGDVSTLKSFCIPRNNGASNKLGNLIKSTGTERITREKLRRLDGFSWIENIRQGFWKVQVCSS